ncbi:hypothetical protein JFL43_11555 [Viridibacillus sp. YIM B01967]|uniref:Uncharacterized protein n=1 Tax=Viridibacillus soli TaxID=2798301 RepID=A0ABS1H7V0_9BACL|nr:hypothetical protein [Viridibacillus soli]MBK3495475.1 hypothetical protein [Viridibacillus soli]
MKLAALLNNQYTDIENRKRALRKKNAGDAYRKTAQYFQPKSNPALEELMDLLTGKKEKEHQPQVQAAIREIQQKDQESRAKATDDTEQTPLTAVVSETTKTSNAASQVEVPTVFLSGSPREKTIKVLERVRHSALTQGEPTLQDIRVADSVVEVTQQKHGQITVVKQQASIEKADNNKIVQAGTEQAINTTQTLEQKLKQRLFDRAISRYSYHVQIAKSGFKIIQPSFYRIA